MKSKTLRVLLAFDGSPSAMAVVRCWWSWETDQALLEAKRFSIIHGHPEMREAKL
jgi:hypothetical protein